MFVALQPSTPRLHFTVHQYIYLHKLHRRGNQEHAQLDREMQAFSQTFQPDNTVPDSESNGNMHYNSCLLWLDNLD
jgi:hypothetical protein